MYRTLVLSALVAIPSALSAQAAADTTRLPEVEVTATRLPTRPDAVTAATTVLSGDALRARGVRTVLEALREVPGAAVVQTGSFGGVTSLFLRGGESDYVKVLVDGIPLNLPGGAVDLAHLTTDNLERIEIVRGPVGVLYGSDAVSGVVQLFTRRGEEGQRATAEAQAGTFGTRRVEASASGGRPESGYAASLSRFGSDGIYPFNNRYRNTTGSVRLRTAPVEDTEAALTVRYTDATAHFPTDFAGIPSDSNQFITEERVALGLDLTRRFGPRVEGRVLLAGSFAELGADNAPDSPADTTGFGFESHRTASVTRRSADARLNLRPGSATTLSLGVQVEFERERQTGRSVSNFGGGQSVDASDFDADRRTVGVYAQAVADLPQGVALNGGMRIDENDAFGTFVTARAGVAWRVRPATRVRATVGTAFKAPTFSELFASSPFEVGNPALDPERTASWEVGAEQTLASGRITLGATWFAQRFRKLIQYRFTAPGDPTYANLGRASASGLELEGAVRPVSALSLTAAYTWLRTEVTDAGASTSPAFADGERLLRRPAHTLRVGAGWLSGSGGTIHADALVIGRRDDVDFTAFPAERVTMPSYVLVNASAEIDVLRGVRARAPVRMTVRVENLLDESYESVIGFRARGRTVYGGAAVRF